MAERRLGLAGHTFDGSNAAQRGVVDLWVHADGIRPSDQTTFEPSLSITTK